MKIQRLRCWFLLAFVSIIKDGDACGNIRASRGAWSVAEGGALHLSCEVQHCGVTGWSGRWAFLSAGGNASTNLSSSSRVQLTNHSLSLNSTRLQLDVLQVNQTDAGSYMCVVTWPSDKISRGHITSVNVTDAAAGDVSSSRSRALVGVAVVSCVVVAVLLIGCVVMVRRRGAPAAPRVPPRAPQSSRATVRVREDRVRRELVYAEVSVTDSSPKKRRPDGEEPARIVYSTVNFSSI